MLRRSTRTLGGLTNDFRYFIYGNAGEVQPATADKPW
jgi:hypothetical protein